jgi:Domain of unknown function (DUF4832)/Domain of unknown function (DUF4874)
MGQQRGALCRLSFHQLQEYLMKASSIFGAVLWLAASSAPTGVAAQTVSSFTIINADTGADIVTIGSSATVSLATTPRINIRANASNVNSVVFTDGSSAKRTENTAPYAYKGNNGPIYTAWAPAAGTYVINAAPFAGSGGRGAAGAVATLTLTVTDGAAPPPPPATGGQVVTYSPDDTTDFINPERGWMDRDDKSAFPGARAGAADNPVGYAVVWTNVGDPWNGVSGNPFRLDNYRQSRLPDSLLQAVRSEFAAARAAGIKLKVRFAYNYSSNGTDTSKEWMLTHIGQLGPVLTENADTIASMDAGFIGKWGEMHSSSHIVTTSGGDVQAAIAEVVQALLNATPDTISVGVRYPRIARSLYGDPGYAMPLQQAFSGSKQSRVGWFNDCLWSSKGNTGTYSTSSPSFEKDRDTFEKTGRYAAASGESCDVGGLNEFNTCPAVLADMAAIGGPDTLFRGFWKDMYSRWISQGCYQEVSRRLGYRLSLLKATLPVAVNPGQPMTVKLHIRNTGFGKVYNKRPLDLVFVGADQVLTARLTPDARSKLPLAGQTIESEWTVAAPAGLKAGQIYQLHLRLPDPSNRLEADPRYAIRLANSNVWDPATGRHNLGASAQVQ